MAENLDRKRARQNAWRQAKRRGPPMIDRRLKRRQGRSAVERGALEDEMAATVVTHESPAWEQTWRAAIVEEAQRIVAEEAAAAAQRVLDRTKELGAKLALQLSKQADIMRMGDTITIKLDMRGLPDPPATHQCSCSHGPHV